MKHDYLILITLAMIYCVWKADRCCAKTAPDRGIWSVGGKEYPFVVSISYKNPQATREQNHICSGTLISHKHVITAAHCVLTESPEHLVVLSGSSDLKQCHVTRVKSYQTYIEWAEDHGITSAGDHGVVILTLFNSVNLKDRFALIPKNSITRSTTTIGWMVGWGISNGTHIPRLMEKVEVRLAPSSNCTEQLGVEKSEVYSFPDSYFLCSIVDLGTFEECGDSGGPILDLKNNFIGIVLNTCSSADLGKLQINFHHNIQFYKNFMIEATAKSLHH